MNKKLLVVVIGLGLLVSGCVVTYDQGKEAVQKVRKVVDILPIPPVTKAKILAARAVADGVDKVVTVIKDKKNEVPVTILKVQDSF